MITKQSIVDRMEARRVALDLTYQQLADCTAGRVSKSQAYHFLAGKGDTSIARLLELAKALGVKVNVE